MSRAVLSIAILGAAVVSAPQVLAQERDGPPRADRLFDRCDRNDDGVIDAEEFTQGLRALARDLDRIRRPLRPSGRAAPEDGPTTASRRGPARRGEALDRRIREVVQRALERMSDGSKERIQNLVRDTMRQARERLMHQGGQRIHEAVEQAVDRAVEGRAAGLHEMIRDVTEDILRERAGDIRGMIHETVRHVNEDVWHDRIGDIERMIHETVRHMSEDVRHDRIGDIEGMIHEPVRRAMQAQRGPKPQDHPAPSPGGHTGPAPAGRPGPPPGGPAGPHAGPHGPKPPPPIPPGPDHGLHGMHTDVHPGGHGVAGAPKHAGNRRPGPAKMKQRAKRRAKAAGPKAKARRSGAGRRPAKAVVGRLADRLDLDGDGVITLEEFKALDRNGDGKLSRKELAGRGDRQPRPRH